jgi:hypothetical protein
MKTLCQRSCSLLPSLQFALTFRFWNEDQQYAFMSHIPANTIHIPANTMVLSEVVPVDDAIMTRCHTFAKWIVTYDHDPNTFPDMIPFPVLHLRMTGKMIRGFSKEVPERFSAILDSIELIREKLGNETADKFIWRVSQPDFTVRAPEHGWVNFLEYYLYPIALDCCHEEFGNKYHDYPPFYDVIASHTMENFHKWYFEEGGNSMEANLEHDAFYKGMLTSKTWVQSFLRNLFMDPSLGRINYGWKINSNDN